MRRAQVVFQLYGIFRGQIEPFLHFCLDSEICTLSSFSLIISNRARPFDRKTIIKKVIKLQRMTRFNHINSTMWSKYLGSRNFTITQKCVFFPFAEICFDLLMICTSIFTR